MSRNIEFTTAFGSARVTASGYLHNLTVSEEHRGKGHGHELLSLVTSAADNSGRRLYTQARTGLHRFYEAHGFAPTEEKIGLGDLPTLRRDPR